MRPMRRSPSDSHAHAPTPLALAERLRLARSLGVSLYELERAISGLADQPRSPPANHAEADLRRAVSTLRDGSGVMPAVRLPAELEALEQQGGRVVDRHGRATHHQCPCADKGDPDFRCRRCDGTGWVPR